MNKRNLALLISKHPLLRKLTEDKTIPKSIVARLIVEELMEAPAQGKFYVGKKGSPGLRVRNRIKGIMDAAVKKGTKEAIQAASERINNFPETFNIEDVSEQHFKILKKFSAHTVSRGVEQVKILQAAEEAEQTPGTEGDKKVQQAQQELDQQDTAAVQKVDQAIKNSTDQGEQTGQPNIDDSKIPQEMKEILKSFAVFLKGQLKINENIGNLIKSLEPNDTKSFGQLLGKTFKRDQLQKMRDFFNNRENIILFIDTYIQDETTKNKILTNLKNIPEKPQEPGKEETPSTPMKGKAVAIEPEKTKAFVDTANQFINEFYNQKYRKDQGVLITKVINAMKEFTEPKDVAVAFARVPTEEAEPKKPIEEQEGQKVKADDDEMRNIRIGLRSFLRRVNKTKEFLTEFQDVAKEGSVLSDSYKKRFIDNLKQIQTAIYRIAIVLNNILGDKEELNEKKESEVMQKMKEVQKLYDLSEKSVGAIKDLLDTETPPKELDSDLTNDAYSALSSLAAHFPSVAPFGSSEGSLADFDGYELKFNNAISRVKSDLQNVFNLIKTGQSGEESLQNARDGLSTFGDEIASIFGVPSRFKDAKVQPGDKKEPAVQEDPEAKKEPPKEEGFLGQLGTIITDSILSFLGDRIYTSKEKQQILKDIEAQKELDEKTKQILSGVVEQYGLPKLQETAKMTSEEMQLYIQLLVALEKKGDIKLNEIVVADNIKQAIESNFEEQERKTLMNILKKDGVYPHLLSLGTDNFGEEGFETFADEEEADDDPEPPSDYKYMSDEERKQAEGPLRKVVQKKFGEKIKKAVEEHIKKTGENEINVNGRYQRLTEILAALQIINQKQKTATKEENEQALASMEVAKDIEEDSVDTRLRNFKQFLGDKNDYKDYDGSKKIIVSYLGAGLGNFFMRYDPIIPLIDEETRQGIRDFINDSSFSPEQETSDLNPKQEETITSAATEALTDVKKENPEASQEETIQAATEKTLQQPEVQEISVQDGKEDKVKDKINLLLHQPEAGVIEHIKTVKGSPDFSDMMGEKNAKKLKGQEIRAAAYYKITKDKEPESLFKWGNIEQSEEIILQKLKDKKRDTVVIDVGGFVIYTTALKALKIKKLDSKPKRSLPEIQDAGALDPKFDRSRPGAPLEERISKKLKPLIREILTKGK